jgi:hypothetical protein
MSSSPTAAASAVLTPSRARPAAAIAADPPTVIRIDA